MSAFALIGIKITVAESYFGEVRTASCSHDFLDENDDEIMFCPKCGNKVNVENGKLAGFDDVESFVAHLTEQTASLSGGNWIVVNGFDEFACMGSLEDDESGMIFVGVGIEEIEGFDRIDMPDGLTVKRVLRELFEPYGLYQAETFGLWAVNIF
jgi:hypothetical protein